MRSMQALDNSQLARAAAMRELAVRLARRDFPTFFKYVFGLAPAAHHRKWMAAVEQYDRAVILAPIEHGKTTVLSVAFPLWVLGNNPNARIGLVSETHSQAARPLAAIREHIVQNQRLHQVFPWLKPAGGAREKWTDSEILVERPSLEKDPSIIALGVLGPLLGARLDLAILDDTVGWENSLTAAQRGKLVDWFRSTLVGRIVAGGRSSSSAPLGIPRISSTSWREAGSISSCATLLLMMKGSHCGRKHGPWRDWNSDGEKLVRSSFRARCFSGR